MPFTFSNTYSTLPKVFYASSAPTPVRDPSLIRLNHELLEELGVDLSDYDEPALASLFSGNEIPDGANPISLAYAGHQFGHFVPQLGDGRAILLGEVLDPSGTRRDIQLKGAGQTPFSRRGDGRSALGPVIREYIMSEAMHALGIPTTRALAAVSSGELVNRESPLPGGVFTRVASSHVRVGTFEYFSAKQDLASITTLADYVIDRHYPEARQVENPYLALLQSVRDAQAELIAKWMHVGFIHGVMNTDNMSVAGETIDYGPCAFMDTFDPACVYSYIDRKGRYAFANQPAIAQWNLTSFAHTLFSLLTPNGEDSGEVIEEVIQGFHPKFRDAWIAGMLSKLGLKEEQDGDLSLVERLLELMHKQSVDYTLCFRLLGKLTEEDADLNELRNLFSMDPLVETWHTQWRERISSDAESLQEVRDLMSRNNPAVVPRNHRVEEAIVAAVESSDYSVMDRLIGILSSPYALKSSDSEYANGPKPEEVVPHTFCGT